MMPPRNPAQWLVPIDIPLGSFGLGRPCMPLRPPEPREDGWRPAGGRPRPLPPQGGVVGGSAPWGRVLLSAALW
jgi:hypothetical protein